MSTASNAGDGHLRAMSWLQRLQETASYKLGLAHGLRNRRPFRFPFWVAMAAYGRGFNEGYKSYSVARAS
jgi:hypothetical protein